MLPTQRRNVNRAHGGRESIFLSVRCSFLGAYDKPRYRDIVDVLSLIIVRPFYSTDIICRQSDRFVLTINCRLIEMRVISNHDVDQTISYFYIFALGCAPSCD